MHFPEGLTVKGRFSNSQSLVLEVGVPTGDSGPVLITPSCLLHFVNGIKFLWTVFLFLQLSAKMWIENGPGRIHIILFKMIVTGW